MTPTYVPKFTYIIPFRYRADRILPLKRVVEWLSGFQGVEVIIVEQDKHSKIDYMSFKANHVFIKSEAPFNKSWSYNVGLKRASSETIIFGDADFIMNPMELIESLRMLEGFDCVIPTSKVLKLSQQESAMDTASILQLKSSHPKDNMLDGISIFKREAINKIGGWNEDLIGIGYENSFNELKVRKFLKFNQTEFTGYHLFHQPDFLQKDLQDRNRQIYDVYNKDQNLLQQHIDQVSPKIGVASRFAQIFI